MAEPHVSSGVLIGATISPVVILLGAQVDALVVGLMVSVFASFWLSSVDSKPKAASGIVLSSLLAGYGSPVAAVYFVSVAPGVAGSGDGLRLLCAALIAAVVPWLLPLLVRYSTRRSAQ
jgi:hypothetical protein